MVSNGAVEKVAFPRFCDDFREKIESLQIDICLSIGDLQTFEFFRKARERWGNGLSQQPLTERAWQKRKNCVCWRVMYNNDKD